MEKKAVPYSLRDRCYVCDVCFREFIPNTATQKHCSSKCADRYQEAQKKRGAWLIFNRDGFRCTYCGKSAYEDGAKLHADHIVPRSVGGSGIAGNLITACSRCNLEKATTRVLDEIELLAEVARRNERAGIDPKVTIKGWGVKGDLT